MALSNMQKLLLIGNVAERNTLIKKLHKLGCAEVVATQKIDKMQSVDIQQDIDENKVKLAKLEFCLETVKEYKNTAKKLAKEHKIDYTPAKGRGMFAVRPVITYESFEDLQNIEADIFSQIEELKTCKDEIIAIKAEKQKLNNLLDSMAPYKNMGAQFSRFKDTKTVNVLLGEVKNIKLPLLEKIREKGGEYEVFDGPASFRCRGLLLHRHCPPPKPSRPIASPKPWLHSLPSISARASKVPWSNYSRMA